MEDITLKACPFCGGEEINISQKEHPRLWDQKAYFLWCDKCGARTDIYDTEEKAILKWQRRKNGRRR